MHKLKQIRHLLGVTQKEMAASIGCNQSNVANYECGQSVPVPAAQMLISFAARKGLAISLDHVYGMNPLPEIAATQQLAQPSTPGQEVA